MFIVMRNNIFTGSLLSNLINIIVGFIVFILLLRLVLRFFGAGQAAPFVRWTYETGDPLLNPFRGMFPNTVLTGGYVLEVNTLIAIVVYAFIGYLLSQLISFITFSTAHYHEEEEERRPRRR